jgi:hypothetical protein
MIILQSTQTFQLFTKIIKTDINTKVIKMQSLNGWVERPTGLIKEGGSSSNLRGNTLIMVENVS